jgi:serine protease SohB
MNIQLWEFALSINSAFALYILTALLISFALFKVFKKSKTKEGKLTFEYLNEKRSRLIHELKKLIIAKEDGRKKAKEYEKSKKSQLNPIGKGRTFVLNFNGNVKAEEVEKLREEITAILTVAQKVDEVVVELNSPGGTVNGYGFASAQLQRIKDAGLKLTILVDQVAASGGYMMAVVGDRIIASPFAYIGSIGVVAEFPNFNRVLKKYGVDYKTYTAGESKRTVTQFGEVTRAGEKKFKDSLKRIHDLFKKHVKENRPKVDIKKIATGEHWTAQEALKMNLVDEIRTSDDYIVERISKSHVYRVSYEKSKTQKNLIPSFAEASINAIFDRIEKYITKNNITF